MYWSGQYMMNLYSLAIELAFLEMWYSLPHDPTSYTKASRINPWMGDCNTLQSFPTCFRLNVSLLEAFCGRQYCDLDNLSFIIQKFHSCSAGSLLTWCQLMVRNSWMFETRALNLDCAFRMIHFKFRRQSDTSLIIFGLNSECWRSGTEY